MTPLTSAVLLSGKRESRFRMRSGITSGRSRPERLINSRTGRNRPRDRDAVDVLAIRQRTLPTDITAQISELNGRVVRSILPNILSNALQYKQYLVDKFSTPSPDEPTHMYE